MAQSLTQTEIPKQANDDCRKDNGTDDSRKDDGTDDSRKDNGTDNSRKDNGTDDSRKDDGTDDSRKDDGTDDSRKDDGTDVGQKDNCNKKDESRHIYGKHETHVSEGGEADLQKHYSSCEKKSGHEQFVPVNDFSKNDLPDGYQDDVIVEFIKATADLTVRLSVKMTSTNRPEFWPNTKVPYTFYDMRGRDVLRAGTGKVWYVNMWKKENKGNCQCDKCQKLDTPSQVWGEVVMFTATHVVFDDLEASHTTCRLFYDTEDSPEVALNGWTVVSANIEEEWCELKCATCDVDLLNKLFDICGHRLEIWDEVYNKFKSFKDKDKLSFIVSHPHGCPKQVSVGQWIARYVVEGDKAQYTYTTCTCPGSSGACVHSLGYDGWSYFDHHVHSGVNSEGANYSGTGRYLI